MLRHFVKTERKKHFLHIRTFVQDFLSQTHAYEIIDVYYKWKNDISS